MTIRKQYPSRSYDTFSDGQDGMAQSPTSYQQGGDADKSRSAAAEARRLASQGSWADNFTGGTPSTNRTPLASTVDGEEDEEVRYPAIPQDDDPSDPPPVYTPSASTAVASQSPAAPASPVVARSVPEPVSAPQTDPSPSNPRASQCSFRHNDEEEGSASLPEAVQNEHEEHDHHHHRHHDEHHDEEADPDDVPAFIQQQDRRKWRWCRRPGKARSCHGRHRHGFGHHRHDKHRARRCKKICFFTLALVACLWLLIPGLCKSLKNVQRPFSLFFV